MKAAVDCIPCFFRQALEAARMVTGDAVKQKFVLDALARDVSSFLMDKTPIHYAPSIYDPIKTIANHHDPFRAMKRRYNEKALRMVALAKKEIERAPDPLLAAVRFALAGNVIDFGPNAGFDFGKEMENVQTHPFGIFDNDAFRQMVRQTKSVLYLGDNAGEIVFDKMLIETVGKPTVYIVRGEPVINDVTLEDAEFVGMKDCAEVISNGSRYPGTVLESCSDEFLSYYGSAELVVSKGQGNFETLSEETKPIVFLLKAKCTVVARHLGVEVGDFVLKKQNR